MAAPKTEGPLRIERAAWAILPMEGGIWEHRLTRGRVPPRRMERRRAVRKLRIEAKKGRACPSFFVVLECSYGNRHDKNEKNAVEQGVEAPKSNRGARAKGMRNSETIREFLEYLENGRTAIGIPAVPMEKAK